MPKPFGMTKRGTLNQFVRDNANRGFTVQEAAKSADTSEQNARAYLNELVSNGRIGKTRTRPYKYGFFDLDNLHPTNAATPTTGVCFICEQNPCVCRGSGYGNGGRA